MSERIETLPDGYRVKVYSRGGIDVCDDRGEWITVASTPESCAALSKIAMDAADCADECWAERKNEA